ncbi:MAG: SIMPL domain-containing protein [Xanthobacteraceae bacterium]
MRSPIIAAVILTICSGLAAAQPAARTEATLTVRGQGEVKVAPDHANMTVEVVTKGKSLDAATAAHRARAQRAADALRDMKKDGLEIERSVFRLNEVRPTPGPGANQGRVETEYQAITTFELKSTRLDKIDGTVTALAATGLFEVRNLRFGIDEKSPGMKAARKNAVDDARDRATTYADAAGVQLGDILKIDDTESRGPRAFAVSAPMMRGVQVVPPETLALSASVTMSWRIVAKP